MIMQHIVATIYKSVKTEKPVGNKLKIGGEIKFLRDIILQNSEFLEDSEGNWIVTFFVGKTYQQQFRVAFTELNHIIPNDKIYQHLDQHKWDYRSFAEISRAACIINAGKNSKTADKNSENSIDNIVERLSLSVRGSKVIKQHDYVEGSSHFHHIDGKGLSFFSTIPDQIAQFRRHILLLVLAHAYLATIEQLGDNLASILNKSPLNKSPLNKSSRDIEELQKEYMKMAEFNSIFFFHQPVLLKNTSLTQVWVTINEALRVHHAVDELLSKLTNAHHTLSLYEKKKQDDMNLKLIVFGTIISLLGLLELFK